MEWARAGTQIPRCRCCLCCPGAPPGCGWLACAPAPARLPPQPYPSLPALPPAPAGPAQPPPPHTENLPQAAAGACAWAAGPPSQQSACGRPEPGRPPGADAGRLPAACAPQQLLPPRLLGAVPPTGRARLRQPPQRLPPQRQHGGAGAPAGRRAVGRGRRLLRPAARAPEGRARWAARPVGAERAPAGVPYGGRGRRERKCFKAAVDEVPLVVALQCTAVESRPVAPRNAPPPPYQLRPITRPTTGPQLTLSRREAAGHLGGRPLEALGPVSGAQRLPGPPDAACCRWRKMGRRGQEGVGGKASSIHAAGLLAAQGSWHDAGQCVRAPYIDASSPRAPPYLHAGVCSVGWQRVLLLQLGRQGCPLGRQA